MSETAIKELDAHNFKSEDYVKKLVKESVGSTELQQRKLKIQAYSDQTSSALKKHVYANYKQFIETASEIKHLESEMYQLSHLLSEQHSLLSSLKEESLLDGEKSLMNEDEEVEEDTSLETLNQRTIKTIKENLHGFTGTLDNKTFIHEGKLIELDSNDYRPICSTHLFLFNDCLIIAKVKHDKKLEFLTKYETKKIAITNIRDGVQNGINVITPEGTKIFQCINLSAKKDWLEKFESAIKFNQIKTKKGPAPLPPTQPQNPFETKSISSDTLSYSESTIEINFAPEWLSSSPEEIQTLIAQRHFEDALSLIQKCDEYILKDSTFYNSADLIEKVKELKNVLSNVLLQELSNSQTGSLQAALRSSRRALKLLGEMGKARDACGTWLRVCTTAIRTGQRQARRNNLSVSDLFFCDLAQVASEFLRAFSSQAACSSSLVVWCRTELQTFASQLIKHYLTDGTQLEVVAKCVEGVRDPCANLTKIGLNLSYYMEGLLSSTLTKLIDESRYRIIETIGRTEEIWQPYNLQTKSSLKSLLRDLETLGIDMKSQVTGDTWINLTQSTVNFCRHFLTVTDSCGLLAKNESLKIHAETLLKDLFLAQQSVSPNGVTNVDLNFVAKNKSYLSEVLLPISIQKFEKISGGKCEILADLVLKMKGPPKPKPRSIYKTDVL